jgi:hypothetical protein
VRNEPERETADHETCFCGECGWTGFEHELDTDQDLADEAGDRKYHERVDEDLAS